MKLKKYVLPSTLIFLFIAFQIVIALEQAPPPVKYDTTNYPEDRAFMNSISNIFDPSLSLNDNSISIGADGSIAYGLEEEMKKFERNGMTFKSVVSFPAPNWLEFSMVIRLLKLKLLMWYLPHRRVICILR